MLLWYCLRVKFPDILFPFGKETPHEESQVSTVIDTFIELSDHGAFFLGILIGTIKYFLGIKNGSFINNGDNVGIDDNEICHRLAI